MEVVIFIENSSTSGTIVLTKPIYIFSGLGADERIFHRLDLSGFSTRFIQWEIPLKRETIENYARRLMNQITTDRPILVGLSFGGLIAIEIAKQIETEKIILIASAKTRNEIPSFYRGGGKLKIHKLLPTHFLKEKNVLTNFISRGSSDSDRQLMKSIFAGTNPVFLRWAIDQVVNWSNETIPENTTHIHGTKDRILPFRQVACDIKIEDGGHLLTLKNADEISLIMRKIIG